MGKAKLSCLVFPSLYGGPKKANHSYSWQINAGLASEGGASPKRQMNIVAPVQTQSLGMAEALKAVRGVHMRE